MKKKSLIMIFSIIICSIVAYLTYPITTGIYALLQKSVIRNLNPRDYAEYTTPLPQNVVDDLCAKFEIEQNNFPCLQNSVVYGPDFFHDIVNYFRELPRQEATFNTVQRKLGTYLDSCDEPNNKGHYRCRYDLRGDGIYPIFIYFSKENHYYRIITNTGGS